MNPERTLTPRTYEGTGQPSTINKPITVNGTTTTIAERLIELRSTGHSIRRCAARVHIHVDTINEWGQVAAHAERLKAADPNIELTPHQARCVDFSERFDEAWATYVAGLHDAGTRLALGGIPIVTVREKVGPDGKVETTTTTTATLPDPRTLIPLLKAAAPEEFGDRLQVDADVLVTQGAESLADTVAAFLTRRDAIDVEGSVGSE